MYYVIPICQKKTLTVCHQSITEAFLTVLRSFHLMKSQVPLKKNPNMENYRKSHRVILVNLESGFQYPGNNGRPRGSIICCPYE